MIAGHFGLAAAAKSRAPEAPLWALMLATVWLDVVFVPLLALGVESITPAAGEPAGYGHAIIHADWTHSVLGAAALSLGFGWISARIWGGRAGVVLGLVAASHWVLDLVVHRADMPWLPGNLGGLPRLGFGLWTHPAAAAWVEALLVVAGAALYLRAVMLDLDERRGLGMVTALLILLGGLGTLAIDVLNIGG